MLLDGSCSALAAMGLCLAPESWCVTVCSGPRAPCWGEHAAAVRAKGAECFREPPTESRPTAGFQSGKGCLPPGSCLVLPVEAGSCQSSSCPGARVVPDQGSLWLAQHGRDVQPLNKAFFTFYFPGWGDLWTSGLTPAAAREGPGFVLHLLWNKTTSLWQGTSSHE